MILSSTASEILASKDTSRLLDYLTAECPAEEQEKWMNAYAGCIRLIRMDSSHDEIQLALKQFQDASVLTSLLASHDHRLETPIRVCMELKSISLEADDFESPIADCLPLFPSLQKLDLSGTYLDDFAAVIDAVPWITILDLSENALTELPPSLGALSQLTKLDLNDNQLDQWPDGLDTLLQLETLYLKNNQLVSIPESLLELKTLVSMDISGNQIQAIPPLNGRWPALKFLYLNDNPITSLTPLTQLEHLTTLSIHGVPAETFPEQLGALTTLSISAEAMMRYGLLAQGQVLITQLTIIGGDQPIAITDIANCTRLESLEIRNCPIGSLEGIGGLAKLKRLTLINNSLSVLTDDLRIPKTLEALTITHQPLTSLPNVFGGFQHLVSIDLTNNQLESLPDSLLLNWSIRILNAYGNPFSPERLADMRLKGRRI
jgi:Leucine-rich repeat (LRR) protein